ncbi:MAG: transposase [Planctomycetota bacterium]|nr:transposase [Planctomycetota bacterium]
MSLGRKPQERQQEFWIETDSLPDVPRHVFYDKLNALLAEGDFDRWIEETCAPYYAQKMGRRGIPPGVYFRMLFIGYFEGIDSQRGIAWRCADSRSLSAFLGYAYNEETPDHSSLSRIGVRIPLEVHEQVFAFVLKLADEFGLLSNKTVAVDSTLLEANAAMKSIVRKDTGDDWKAYVRGLAEAAGVPIETDDDLRKFDKNRKDKKVSNDEWASPSDPAARIMKMKDGTTHLSYKAEHTIDLDSEFILAATIYQGHQADMHTLTESLSHAADNLEQAGGVSEIEEAVADKGYHSNQTLLGCRELGTYGTRTYIAESELNHERRWTDKPEDFEAAYRANRRRNKGARGQRLQKQRSERVERSFAHTCETGGARRTWLRGIEKVTKRYQMVAAARNLGLIMLKLFGVGKPRCLQGLAALLAALIGVLECFRNASKRRWEPPNDCLFIRGTFDASFSQTGSALVAI